MAELLIATDEGLFGAGGDRLEPLAGRKVDALALDADGWWALVDSQTVWRAAGAQPPGAVAELAEYECTCLLARDGHVLVGTEEAHLLRVAGGDPEPVESFDEVDGRDAWYTPWGGPPAIRTLAAGPDGTLWANVHVGGIVRSTDDGATWTPTIDIHADVHQVTVAPDQDATVLAACAWGLAVGADSGQTWSYVSDGLHATYSRAVAATGDMLYLSASAGPGGRRAALYRRGLAGGSFERCQDGLPEWFEGNIDSGCLAAVGNEVAFGIGGDLWLSTDAGHTWDLTASWLPTVRAVVMR